MGWQAAPVALPPDGGMAAFELAGLELLLCNVEGVPYVVEDECPHVQTPLDGGVLRGCVLECPLHSGKLDVRDGSPVEFPIRRPVRTFPAKLEGEQVWIEID